MQMICLLADADNTPDDETIAIYARMAELAGVESQILAAFRETLVAKSSQAS